MNKDANEKLNTPGRRRRLSDRVRFDQETFGVFAEWIARFMGSPAFMIWMTIFLAVWLLWNTVLPRSLWFDENPFILLTLMLSIEAAYSAPLILLAQNRQEARDRRAMAEDRRESAQTKADMDFLAREIASIRMSVGELATRDFLRSEIRTELKNQLREIIEEVLVEIEQSRQNENSSAVSEENQPETTEPQN